MTKRASESSENIQMHQLCRILGLQNCLIDILFNDFCGSQNIKKGIVNRHWVAKREDILQTPGKVYSSYVGTHCNGFFRTDDSEKAVCMKKQYLELSISYKKAKTF